jgi:hypothetical protein
VRCKRLVNQAFTGHADYALLQCEMTAGTAAQLALCVTCQSNPAGQTESRVAID